MKNIGVVLTVGITAVILITIGVFNVLLAAEAETPVDAAITPAVAEEVTAVPDLAAVQAAYDARETLLQAQIAELDSEYSDRQAAYELRVEEYSSLLLAGEDQLSQLQDQETVLQEQIDQLLAAQMERAANNESQRQQAYYQYQVNIQQLQGQLDEAHVKLSDALAQLGQ